VVPTGLDVAWPAVAHVASTVIVALFLIGLIGLTGGFLAGILRQRWMQAVVLLIVTLAAAGSAAGPAEFAKNFLFALLQIGVVMAGVVGFYRFNMLAYALTVAVLSLSQAAIVLLRQPAPYYQWNGYAVLAVLLGVAIWPLLTTRESDAAPSMPLPGGAGDAPSA
jgi:hypothetical protein